jgi:hypothetical protein
MTQQQHQQQPGTAVATVDQQPGKAVARQPKPQLAADGHSTMPIVPRDIPQAMRYADGLIHSGNVPDAYKIRGTDTVNASLVAMAILKALEIGLAPQTGIQSLLPINGRFTVWGDGAQALVLQSGKMKGHRIEWVGPEFKKNETPLAQWPNEYGCRFTAERYGVDDPVSWTFTVGDARRANLWNNSRKQPWLLYPEIMLMNRARAFVFRMLFADALAGLGIAEEMRDQTGNYGHNSRGLVDNSALDDDLPEHPTHGHTVAEGQPYDADTASAALDAYKEGLGTVASLEALEDYQSKPEHVRLFRMLRENDEARYHDMVAANSHRFQEIEVAERAAEKQAVDAAAAAAGQEGGEA